MEIVVFKLKKKKSLSKDLGFVHTKLDRLSILSSNDEAEREEKYD